MIVIFTDYGLTGPYVGQVESVLLEHAPDQRIIRLLTDAPSYNPMASAYLLSAICGHFPPKTVFFAVVDPAVGSGRDKPVIIEAEGRWYVGADNGLFDILARHSNQFRVWEISWRPQHLSQTFHGRDLYAPVCGMLASGLKPPGEEFEWTDPRNWPDDLYQIIYTDHFGNAMTGIRADQLDPATMLTVCGHRIKPAGKFSDVKPGQGFWYLNSYDLVEIAVNQGNAAQQFDISTGSVVELSGVD